MLVNMLKLPTAILKINYKINIELRSETFLFFCRNVAFRLKNDNNNMSKNTYEVPYLGLFFIIINSFLV